MSKEYEFKSISAEMVMVDFDTDIEKRNGGTYQGTNIIYKAFGKVNEKGFTTKTFEFKPDLRGQLESVSKKGTLFTIELFREVGSEFWNINEVVPGHKAKDPVVGNSNSDSSSANPAAVGQAINLAVSLGMAKSYEGFTPNVIRQAIISYKSLKEEFTSNWEAADKEPAPKQEESFDDDIPF